jgi:hypothetical protein
MTRSKVVETTITSGSAVSSMSVAKCVGWTRFEVCASFAQVDGPLLTLCRSGGTTSPPPRAQSIHYSRYSSLSSISTRRAESSIDAVPACFGFLRVDTAVFSNMRGLTSVEPHTTFVPVSLALLPALTHLRLGSSYSRYGLCPHRPLVAYPFSECLLCLAGLQLTVLFSH